VATGDAAEIGKINTMVATVDGVKTDLMVQLEILGRWISISVAAIALTAFLLAHLRHGEKVGDAFKTAVAIAVAIIPEGLPAVVTITLAIGTTKMARQCAIIRQLPAVETLGALTVICSDKTGTLTKNEMTVVSVRTASTLYAVSGVGYAPTGVFSAAGAPLAPPQLRSLAAILEGSVLCNDSALSRVPGAKGGDGAGEQFVPQGAPTEVSLIVAALKAGIDIQALQAAKPRVASVPFESEHKFMATVHSEGAGTVMFVKGAPERLLPICRAQVVGDDLARLEPLDAPFWLKAQADLSSQGLRVIALCRCGARSTQLKVECCT
jgi:magnesium-transporting ATPase (P-type)